MREITKLAFVAASVSMLFASCQKDSMISEGVADLQRPIEVNPVTGFEGTRSAIYGSTMPFDRNLVISAVYKNESNRGVQGPTDIDFKNYFQGVTFAYNASKKTWSSDDNPVYWPLTGSLDFLAYSTEDDQIRAAWGPDKWTEGVELSNFTNNDISDDLLYGVAQNSSPSTTAVPITFKHAKALIVFTAKASFDEAIEIKSIELENVQPVTPSTTVTLPNPNGTGALTWAQLGTMANQGLPGVTDDNRYTVPRTKIDVTKKSGYLGIGGEGIMLAPQAMTKIKVTFSQQYKGTGPSPVNGNEIEETFTYDCKFGLAAGAQEWEAGKRYVYELDFRVNEINVVASVESWQDTFDENPPYVIDIPEVDIPEVANYTNTGTTDMMVPVDLVAGTKFIFDDGDGEVTYTNNYPYAVGTGNTPNIDITLKANKTAKFYVSEGGQVEVKISNKNLVISEVYDHNKFIVYYEVTLDAGEHDLTYSTSNSRLHKIFEPVETKFDKNLIKLHFDRTDHIIDDWYKDPAFTESSKWDFATDKVTQVLTLYAKWDDDDLTE